jgi:outer membrane beta-barrel protein
MGGVRLLFLAWGTLALASPALAQDVSGDAAATASPEELASDAAPEEPAAAGDGEAAPAEGGTPADEKAEKKADGPKKQAASDQGEGGQLDTAPEGTGESLAERIQAVSRKVFIKRYRFEMTPLVGFSLNDAFYQRINGGLRLSFHILESLAVDVGGAFNPIGLPLPTVVFLREAANDQFVNTAPFWGYVDAGLTFAPIYGKFSLMSEYVIHFDAYFSGGIGATFDGNRNFIFGPQISGDCSTLGADPLCFVPSVNPALEIGAGFRVFFTKWLALRLEVRDFIYAHNRGSLGFALQNMAMVNLGISIWFPLGFEYEYQQ